MPSRGVLVRQRYNSFSGYSSSGGEELEEDTEALGTPKHGAMALAMSRTEKSWWYFFENVLWIGSAAFIIYFGDLHSNFITLLLRDSRIRRTALNLGVLCIVCIALIFLYLAFWVKDMAKVENRWEIVTPFAIPTATLLGLIAFFLFCLALWPIWSFLTLPLLFTLFMAFVVISPYIPPYVKVKPDSDMFRMD